MLPGAARLLVIECYRSVIVAITTMITDNMITDNVITNNMITDNMITAAAGKLNLTNLHRVLQE